MALSPEQAEYINYVHLFKDNYRKGLDRLRGYAENEKLKDEIVQSRPALDVIFASEDKQTDEFMEILANSTYGSDISDAYIAMLGATDIVNLLDQADVSDTQILNLAYVDKTLRENDTIRDSFFDHEKAVGIFGTNATEKSEMIADRLLSGIDKEWATSALDSKQELLAKNTGFLRAVCKRVVNDFYPSLEGVDFPLLDKLSPYVEKCKDVFMPWLGKTMYLVTSEKNYFKADGGIPYYTDEKISRYNHDYGSIIQFDPYLDEDRSTNNVYKETYASAILIGLAQDKDVDDKTVGFTFLTNCNGYPYVRTAYYGSSYNGSEYSQLFSWDSSKVRIAFETLYNAYPSEIKPYVKLVKKNTPFQSGSGDEDYSILTTEDHFFLPTAREVGICFGIYMGENDNDSTIWYPRVSKTVSSEEIIKAFESTKPYDLFVPMYNVSIDQSDTSDFFIEANEVYKVAIAPQVEYLKTVFDEETRASMLSNNFLLFRHISFRTPAFYRSDGYDLQLVIEYIFLKESGTSMKTYTETNGCTTAQSFRHFCFCV